MHRLADVPIIALLAEMTVSSSRVMSDRQIVSGLEGIKLVINKGNFQ